MSDAEPSQALSERQLKIAALVDRLTLGVPDDPSERTAEQQARWILAHCLDWHRREKKVSWWEYFRLSDLPAEDLLDERAGLGGLKFVEALGGTLKAPVHRYQFPPQEASFTAAKMYARQAASNSAMLRIYQFQTAGWTSRSVATASCTSIPKRFFAHNDVDTTLLMTHCSGLADTWPIMVWRVTDLIGGAKTPDAA